MSVKIGINGLGRIGKLVFRLLSNDADMEVTHINDKMDTQLMAHLLKYDSIHGKFLAEIEYDENHIIVNGKRILVTNYQHPEDIPWAETGVTYILDSCGRFKTRETLQGHLRDSVQKVILSCPPDDASIERTIVMGVNHHTIKETDTIISNASCTTNCIAVMLKVINDEFGMKRGFMNTVHPTTNNQNLQDGFHSDYRRARSAMGNIIPTSSSAVRAVHLVIPEMKNIFDGFATRVPVADCSFVELVAEMHNTVTAHDIRETFLRHANGQLHDYLEYCNDPIVSSDITNNPHSAIFDALATKVIGGNFIQVLGWYDNEYGYSSRIIDLLKYVQHL
ncbi:MAG: type I glyceraldehyde-3-phosphate dehydrogenase [Bacteroidales bacterium]|nr:type I glyceraldehyde-3-phosphate dehydrogenase [Bacteroidales bacterium]